MMIANENLSGFGIELRSLIANDVHQDYFDWLIDPEVNKYLEVRHSLPKNIDELRQHVQLMAESQNDYLFGIYLSDTQKHIGNIKIGNINKRYARAEVGILLGDKAFWGKGYGTAAIRLAANFSFARLELRKLIAGCYESNGGSSRAFIKAGFFQQGLISYYWNEDDSNSIGEVILGLDKRNYLNQNNNV